MYIAEIVKQTKTRIDLNMLLHGEKQDGHRM